MEFIQIIPISRTFPRRTFKSPLKSDLEGILFCFFFFSFFAKCWAAAEHLSYLPDAVPCQHNSLLKSREHLLNVAASPLYFNKTENEDQEHEKNILMCIILGETLQRLSSLLSWDSRHPHSKQQSILLTGNFPVTRISTKSVLSFHSCRAPEAAAEE